MISTYQVDTKIKVELLKRLNSADLLTLCESAESTMLDTYGFSIGSKKWQPPMNRDLEEYFSGVMLIQERQLIVGRVAKDIVGSLQLLLPHKQNKISSFAMSIHDLFVIRPARYSGIAQAMFKFAEDYARAARYKLIKLSLRADMEAAITLVEKLKYKRWGVLDKYEFAGDQIISGYFYCKEL